MRGDDTAILPTALDIKDALFILHFLDSKNTSSTRTISRFDIDYWCLVKRYYIDVEKYSKVLTVVITKLSCCLLHVFVTSFTIYTAFLNKLNTKGLMKRVVLNFYFVLCS